MFNSSEKPDKQQEGKAIGLSFAACVLRGRVYSREGGLMSHLYLIPLVLAYLCPPPSLPWAGYWCWRGSSS